MTKKSQKFITLHLHSGKHIVITLKSDMYSGTYYSKKWYFMARRRDGEVWQNDKGEVGLFWGFCPRQKR